MCKKLLVAVIAAVLIPLSSHSQVFIQYWDKVYGGDSREWNNQIWFGPNGKLMIAGDSQSDVAGNKSVPLCNPGSDLWYAEIDTSGNMIWQKGLGGDSDERSPQLYFSAFSPGAMYLLSHSTSDSACNKLQHNVDTIPLLSSDYWLCKVDINGNKVWDVTIGGDNYDDNVQLAESSNGDLLLAGESNSPVSGNKTVPNYSVSNDLWILRVNNSGTVIWDKVFGNDGAEYLASVIRLPNGGFLIGGSTMSDIGNDISQTTRGSADYWLIRIDDNGNKIWDKRFGGSGVDRCSHVALTADGGFLLTGFTTSPVSGEVTEAPKGMQDYWIVKTDSSGILQWEKRFGGSNSSFATWADNAPGGGYWISGYSNSTNVLDVSEPGYGGTDYWVLKIDPSGSKLWDKRFGGSGDEFSTSFQILADSSLMLFGYSDTGNSVTKSAVNSGWYDYWMVKFRYRDIFLGSQNLSETGNEIHIYPNPGRGVFQITCDGLYPGPLVYKIYDIAGKQLLNQTVIPPGSNVAFSMDLTGFSKGMYFFTITDLKGEAKTKKIILE